MNKRAAFYIGLAAFLLLSILYKRHLVIESRNAQIVSSLSIFEKVGKPVRIEKISNGISNESIRYKNNTPFLFVEKNGVANLLPITIVSRTSSTSQIAPLKGYANYIKEGGSILRNGDKVYPLERGIK